MLKNKIKIKKFLSPVILAVVVLMWAGMILMPQAAWAADICAKDEIVLQVPIPGIPGNGYCVKGFPEYLEAIYNLFVGVSGILAVIMIMFGGFQWLIAGGNSSKIGEAKATILAALAGLTLLLTSYTILNLINPNLTNLVDLTKKVQHIDPQSASGGYCVAGIKLANNLTWDKAMCGTQYSLLNSASATCKGVSCLGRGVFETIANTALGSVSGEVCFSSSGVDYCADKIILEKAKAAGYDVEAGVLYRGNEGNSNRILICGNIYYRPLITASYTGLKVGAFCTSGLCIIKDLDNYSISMSKDKTDSSVSNNLVGKFNQAYCY